LPVVMADDLKTSATIELRALRLLNFQRQVNKCIQFMWCFLWGWTGLIITPVCPDSIHFHFTWWL